MASIDPNFTLAKRVHCLRNIDYQTWPLIILANFRESRKNKLVEILRTRKPEYANVFPPREKIQTWTPSASVLASMAQQGPYRDSQANLYALAVLAYQSGHSKFLVADELSQRQLDVKLYRDKTFMLSVVLIWVYEDPSSSEHLTVWARRELCRGEPIEYMFARFESTRETPLSVGNPDSHLREYFQDPQKNPGSQLHDPDRPVLSLDAKASLARESQLQAMDAALSRLPVELVMDIVARTGTAQTFENVFWKEYPCEHHLVIFLLFPATPDQIYETTAVIEDALIKRAEECKSLGDEEKKMTFELIPWEKHGIRSRRNLMAFWLFYNSRTFGFSYGPPLLHLLLEPIAGASEQCFGTVTSSIASVAIAWRQSLKQMIEQHAGKTRWQQLRDGFLNMGENICNPDDPFYYRSHQWQTTGYYSTRWIPVVYLTNHLSEEQEQGIKEKVDPPQNGAGFERWKSGAAGDFDGTVQDIWEIAQRVEQASFHKSFRAGDCCFVCIDQESAVDEKIIAVSLDTYSVKTARRKWTQLRDLPNPRLQGVSFARVPARHARFTSSLSIGMPFGGDNLTHFIRPDLRPHGRLEYRQNYVDGNGNAVTLEDDINPEEREETPS